MWKLIERYVKSQDNDYAYSPSSKTTRDSKKPSKVVYSVSDSKGCVKCKKDHYLNQCEEFRRLSGKERVNFVISNGLCKNCLHPWHIAIRCRRTPFCRQCSQKHHDLLHDCSVRISKRDSSGGATSSDIAASQSNANAVGIACVEVLVAGRRNVKRLWIPSQHVICVRKDQQRSLSWHPSLSKRL